MHTALRRQSLLRTTLTTARNLHLHEYQSQALMRKFGINTPFGVVVSNGTEARKVAAEFFDKKGCQDVVVKAQVLAGGRGLGVFDNGFKGGVHVCHSTDDVANIADNMLGHRLITKQTKKSGVLVHKVLLTERLYSRRELYVAFVMDRTNQGIALVASTKGGVNIEKVAEEDPRAIVKIPINPVNGLTDREAMDVAHRLGFVNNAAKFVDQLQRMYKLFTEMDCVQLEINPFVETPNGDVLCLDAKLNFDTNAQFRHEDLFKMHDPTEDDPREIRAREFDLNYIPLSGNVGCLVNGAGLAMATMDVIQLKGGEPANFLDIGGGANENQVYEALRIMADDPAVHAILINIFGGIMRCDVIATGLINAVTKLNLKKPIVVRLKGTNQAQALKLIEASKLRIIPAEDLNDAAQKAVHIANIAQIASKINISVNFEAN